MAHAYAEYRHLTGTVVAVGDELLSDDDRFRGSLRITGTVGYEHSIRLHGQNGLRFCSIWEQSKIAASSDELPEDAGFDAQVHDSHSESALLRFQFSDFFCSGSLHLVIIQYPVGADMFKCIDAEVLCSNDALHVSFISYLACKLSGVHIINSRNLLFPQPLVYAFLTSPVGWFETDVLGNKSISMYPFRFKVYGIYAVVAYERIGHCYYLFFVRWICQSLLIAGHGSVEYKFSNPGPLIAKTCSFVYGTVFKINDSLHYINSFRSILGKSILYLVLIFNSYLLKR